MKKSMRCARMIIVKEGRKLMSETALTQNYNLSISKEGEIEPVFLVTL